MGSPCCGADTFSRGAPLSEASPLPPLLSHLASLDWDLNTLSTFSCSLPFILHRVTPINLLHITLHLGIFFSEDSDGCILYATSLGTALSLKSGVWTPHCLSTASNPVGLHAPTLPARLDLLPLTFSCLLTCLLSLSCLFLLIHLARLEPVTLPVSGFITRFLDSIGGRLLVAGYLPTHYRMFSIPSSCPLKSTHVLHRRDNQKTSLPASNTSAVWYLLPSMENLWFSLSLVSLPLSFHHICLKTVQLGKTRADYLLSAVRRGRKAAGIDLTRG